MNDEGDGNLVFAEVRVVAPVVLVVLVVLMRMVAGNEDKGVVVHTQLFHAIDNLTHHPVGLIGGITIEIPEGGRIHIIV